MPMTLDEFKQRTGDGRIFTVAFVKRTTGEERVMNCRTGVSKGTAGGSIGYDPRGQGPPARLRRPGQGLPDGEPRRPALAQDGRRRVPVGRGQEGLRREVSLAPWFRRDRPACCEGQQREELSHGQGD